MKYYVRKPGTNQFSGPYSLEEIYSQIKAEQLSLIDEAIEANGQTFRQLKKSTEWVLLSSILKSNKPSPESEELSEPEKEDLVTGMTGGEWLGAIVCTPYGLIKYFQWSGFYPRKSKQVCYLYLIALLLNILLVICRAAMESSSY